MPDLGLGGPGRNVKPGRQFAAPIPPADLTNVSRALFTIRPILQLTYTALWVLLTEWGVGYRTNGRQFWVDLADGVEPATVVALLVRELSSRHPDLKPEFY